MDPIVTFLKQGMLPEDKGDAEKVRRNAPCYWLFEEPKLYKCSYSGPYLCVYTLRQWSPCWKNYMRGYMGVISKGDP